ncbi:CpaD family pilus assembly lipoprotein [Paraburkholderia sediminicola]|uniref:CpaD family pilus assembly lipoprotein n=1 Tax=Paraburkholderia sediminicola TaxID=458836 RepID=UPI0038BD7474
MKRASTFTFALLCVTAFAVSGCFKPPVSMPDASTIGYDGKHLTPPDCSKLEHPSLLLDAGVPRPSMAWGCATYTNLAAQIANPQDFVAPQPLGPADAAIAASAVRRYETEHVYPLPSDTTRAQK